MNFVRKCLINNLTRTTNRFTRLHSKIACRITVSVLFFFHESNVRSMDRYESALSTAKNRHDKGHR